MPADDSHEISFLISLEKLGKMLQNLLSAAVLIGTLRFNLGPAHEILVLIKYTPQNN